MTIKGKRQTITLTLVDGSTLDIPGTVYGTVGIVRLETGEYRLIHLKSGWQIGDDYEYRLAVRLAIALNAVDLDTMHAVRNDITAETTALRDAARVIIASVGSRYYTEKAAGMEMMR